MITAVFTDNDDYAHAYGLWQWDYGQQLRIEGLHLPTAVEIHFALQETGGEAIPRVGTTKDGVTTVTIPDSMLEGNSTVWTADKTYNIYAWVYLSDKLSGETIKRITMQVKSRPKPKAFEVPGDGEIFHEAIEAVNDAAKRAEEAGDKAIAAADEAKAAATQTAEHLEAVHGLAEQVETNADTVAQDKQAVAGMLSQTQQAASDAALSAQAAKLSETAAVQAQTGAEAAEDGARQYAEETGADRQAVANDKQVVSQMREAVAADRQAVEQTALQFGQTSQDALTAIGQAQSTAVGAVKAEGNKQTTAVQEAGTQAVREVAEAKTTAVQAVTTEGDKQTKRVEDAAAGIIADREQISQNKTDIAGLAEGMTDLAPAIHSTVSDSTIIADDATEGRPFRGLRVFGKSTQDGTPTPEAPIPIVSAGESGNITVEVRGKNLLQLQDGRGGSRGVEVTCRNGEISLVGTATETGWTILEVNPPFVLNGDYALSTSNDVGCYLINNDYKTVISTLKPQNIVNGEVTKIAFGVTEGKIYNMNGIKVMLNRGLTASPYEPPRIPQSLTLQTPNGLPGIPVSKDGNYTDADGQQWICDEIDLGRGKYVQRISEKEVSEITWSGAGAWGNTDDYKTLAFYAYIDGSNINEDWDAVKNYGICNYATITSNVFNNSIIGFTVGDYIAFRVPRSLLPDWDENNPSVEPWTNWLKARKEAGNPVIVRYALKTSIERDLTPEEIAAYKALRTYGPTTVITNDAGAGMEVTYVADTKAYIDKKFKELNQAIVNTQIALL